MDVQWLYLYREINLIIILFIKYKCVIQLKKNTSTHSTAIKTKNIQKYNKFNFSFTS